MTLEDKVHAFRLHVLQRAKEEATSALHAVRQGSHERCTTTGGSGSRCAVRMDCTPDASRHGPAGRHSWDRFKERTIIAMALAWPTWGPPTDQRSAGT